ncbi:hypothetical protein O181_010847 [Austropuccinia psidii MF-1]|uniref:Uncharacterized protein n=1 Tax=Austropuccinia psidii MF-1 TaxID=1389203 RepID=A0A9Q3GLL2_9BASI|nr:hypothetical protein [Austropuccinia psidii MF-1]
MNSNVKRRPNYRHVIFKPLISYTFLFQDLTPLQSLCLIHLNSLNGLLPCLGAQELTIKGGIVTTMGRTPPNLCSRKDKPPPIYGQLAILSTLNQLTSYGMEWTFGHIHFSWSLLSPNLNYFPQAISCIIGPFGQFPISQSPGQHLYFWAWGVIQSSMASVSSGPSPLIKGFMA